MTTIFVSKKLDLPERHVNDLYTTEPSLIKAAIETFVIGSEYGVHALPKTILDIGAYDGRWGSISKKLIPTCKSLAGVELVNLPTPRDFTFWICGKSYLDTSVSERIQTSFPKGFDLIVSNPPYYAAEHIVRKAWTQLAQGGRMIMLLRLSFQAGVDRYRNLWARLPLTYLGVLSRRPSFYGGKTSGTDYGLFVWDKRAFENKPVGTPRSWTTVLVNYER